MLVYIGDKTCGIDIVAAVLPFYGLDYHLLRLPVDACRRLAVAVDFQAVSIDEKAFTLNQGMAAARHPGVKSGGEGVVELQPSRPG